MASLDKGPATDVDAVLDLQHAAGNRAVVQLLAGTPSGTPPPVQRRPSFLTPDDDEPRSRIDPGALVLKPDDSGKPADQMEWAELEDAIDENESIVRSATQSTPDVRRRRARLVELYAAQQKLGSKAAAGAQGKTAAPRPAKTRGRKQPPPAMPPKPETLTRGSIDWANTPGAVARRELSLVVAYLAANPPKADREILLLELPNIERAAGAARAEKQQARHIEQVTEALSPKGGSDQDKFDEILRRLQNAERDTAQEDVWLVHYEGRVLPLSSAELAAVRERVGKGLMEAARKISRFVYDVEGAWEERTQHNRSHSRTHRLVKFATGADDIPRSDIDKMLSNSRFYTSRIRNRATSGQLVEAGNDLAVFDRNARYYAEKVGNWESELMRGAGRWVLGLTILKEALSIMAGFGAARLAALAGGGSTIATFKAGAKIATMTTGTGLLAGGAGAEAAGGDWKKGARAGGGAGFGVGASALTAGVGKIASVGDAAKASTLGGKALAVTKAGLLETGAGVVTSTTQAAIEGGDLSDAALGAVVSNPISALGGGAVDKLAKSKAAATLGKTGVGVIGGVASAAATDQDLIHGGLSGGAGALYGGLATPFPGNPAGGGGPPPPGSDEPGAPAGPTAGATLVGTGIEQRPPSRPRRDTMLGVGIEPREPAAPATTLGTGIEPRPPAAPRRDTTLGIGIEPRLPARPAAPQVDPLGATMPGVSSASPDAAPPTIASPDALATTLSGAPRGGTIPGVGVGPDAPAPAGPGAVAGGGGPRNTGAALSIPPDPAKLIGGDPTKSTKSQFAALDEYKGRPPIQGQVALIITKPEDAQALYRRLNGADRRPAWGTESAELEGEAWRDHGGQGDPPIAWVRASDGAVRFNFSAFQRPNLGGYTTEPMKPLPMPGARAQGPQPAPAQQPMTREWARLPEYQGKAPLFGPESKVVHVITDKAEAQRIWNRFVAERQLHILEYPESVGSLRWSEHGGVGPAPMAWITADGIVRFTTDLFRPGSIVE